MVATVELWSFVSFCVAEIQLTSVGIRRALLFSTSRHEDCCGLTVLEQHLTLSLGNNFP